MARRGPVKQGERLSALLESVGARLKRQRKHLIFELPNGNTFTTSKTPSDRRAEDNAISDLRRAAGLERESKPPSERERRKKHGREDRPWLGQRPFVSPLTEAMRSAGLVEQRLRDDIAKLEQQVNDLRWKVLHREARVAAYERWWLVRLAARLGLRPKYDQTA